MPYDLLASVSVHAWVACLMILPLLWKPEISCLLVMLYDQYTLLSSNKHDSTNPASDPSPPLSPVSVFHSITQPSSSSFGSSSLRRGGSTMSLWQNCYIFSSPSFLSGLFSSPAPLPLVHSFSSLKMFWCSGRNRSFVGGGPPTQTFFFFFFKQRCGFHSFISPSFHVSISSCVGLKSGMLKNFILLSSKATRSSSGCRWGEFMPGKWAMSRPENQKKKEEEEKWGGGRFPDLPWTCAHKSLVPPDFQLNADVWMTTLPVTPSACGNYASVEYNELHVWLFEGLEHWLMNWRLNVFPCF